MSYKIVLVGNPNCGKTTLFNYLTGDNQYVGNWPGVTVEKKEGRLKKHSDVIVVDLPGIYSLSPYTMEEVVTRDYLVDENPDVVINIVDGTNLERNLYLTTQVLEFGIPVVLAINMMDLVRKRGNKIDTALLSNELGVPVIEISAINTDGIEELIDKSLSKELKNQKILRHNYKGPVEHTIAHIEEACVHHLPEHVQRWHAIKIFENDEKIIKKLNINKDVIEHISKDIKKCEEEMGDKAENIITNERYIYIGELVKLVYQKKTKENNNTSDKIDRVVTSKWLGIPIFIFIMFVVFYFSISTIGKVGTDFISDVVFGENGIPLIVDRFLTFINCNIILKDLVINGIIAGVGSVISFIPQFIVLFFFLAFLEQCGYMSRVAFLLDRVFRKIGLSGKSFIPILIGVGCGVPGIMSSRTIENEDDRRMTIITTTFIPCSAKTPVIAMISGTIFAGAWWVAPSSYFLGIFAIVCSGIILKKTGLFGNKPAPLIIELPSYQMPKVKNIFKSIWERISSFVKKAGTIILLASMILWCLSYFGFKDGTFTYLSNDEMNYSILSSIGNVIRFIFIPLGFGTWQATVSTLTGIIAKENIVSTMNILYGVDGFNETIRNAFTYQSAYAFLAFNLLCAPCIAAIGAISREMNSKKWTLFAILYQTLFAYVVSMIIYMVGSMGTLLVILVLALVVLSIITTMIKDKKNGKGYCGCDCENCNRSCHK